MVRFGFGDWRWLPRRGAPGVAVLLSVCNPMAAQEQRLVATVARPATVPVSRPATAAAAQGAASRVVIGVSGFQPSPSGPVQAVVTAACDGAEVEIGRFGILPQAPFTASDPAREHRFSLTVPADAGCQRLGSVTIRLVPTQGDGAGAVLEIGRAELR